MTLGAKSKDIEDCPANAEQEHGWKWVDLIRIAFVVLAAAGVVVSGLGTISAHQRDRDRSCADWRLSHFRRRLREYRGTKSDDETVARIVWAP